MQLPDSESLGMVVIICLGVLIWLILLWEALKDKEYNTPPPRWFYISLLAFMLIDDLIDLLKYF